MLYLLLTCEWPYYPAISLIKESPLLTYSNVWLFCDV